MTVMATDVTLGAVCCELLNLFGGSKVLLKHFEFVGFRSHDGEI